jgi:hypothetical protein
LEVARAVRDEGQRSGALAALAPRLPGPLLAEALELARAIGDEQQRSGALAALAAQLAELGFPSESLEVARAVRDEGQRSGALAAVARLLAEGPARDQALQEALEAALAVRDEGQRFEALAALGPHLATISPTALNSIWHQTLRLLVTRSRSELLADLVALVPVIAALGGAGAVIGMRRAIRDVGRWWP